MTATKTMALTGVVRDGQIWLEHPIPIPIPQPVTVILVYDEEDNVNEGDELVPLHPPLFWDEYRQHAPPLIAGEAYDTPEKLLALVQTVKREIAQEKGYLFSSMSV